MPQVRGATYDDQARAAAVMALAEGRSATLVRVRVFAVGSASLARARAIFRETLSSAGMPLPAINFVGVVAFPEPDRQIAVELTLEGHRDANADGLVLMAGLAAPTGDRIVTGLKRVLAASGSSAERVLRLSCFYEAPDQLAGARSAIAGAFVNAQATFVHSYGSAAQPLIECEGIARPDSSSANEVSILTNLPGGKASPNYSLSAFVRTPHVIFTSTQVAVAASDVEMHAMFMRVRNAVTRLGGRMADVAMGDNFWLTPEARDALRTVRPQYLGGTVPAATGVFFAGLAEPTAVAGVDYVVALRELHDTLTLRPGSASIDGRYLVSHLATLTQTLTRNGVNEQVRRFTLDKHRSGDDSSPAFHLQLEEQLDSGKAGVRSQTVLDLRTMRTLQRTDEDPTGRSMTATDDGSTIRGTYRAARSAPAEPFSFSLADPAFYVSFLDAIANATPLRAGLTLRIPTYRYPPSPQTIDWHVFTVTGTDTVRVGDHLANAWVIEETDWPGYRSRKIWLMREAPFFPRDVTVLNDGSVRTSEQGLVRMHV